MIDASWLAHAAIGLLPALCFLAALLLLDSYKLVRLRMVLTVIGLGGVMAGICYVINTFLIDSTGLAFETYSRYVAPAVEESLKAVVVVVLIRRQRIGFLVDASVLGFAVGAGFATIENLYYLGQLVGLHAATWMVRGFGTAILHGGIQAIFAALVITNVDSQGKLGWRAVLPPLIFIILVHAAFNQFVVSPVVETVVVLISIPPVLFWVFAHSEHVLRGWLSSGFDADQELLALLQSDTFSESHAGTYLYKLRERLPGEVVADMLCYLQLYVELALYAKGMLMLRDSGIEMPIDEETRAKLEEMKYLESSVGRAGLMTLQPLMHTSRRDLWQLHMLGK